MKPERRGGRRNFWTAIDDQILRDGFDTMTLAELCRKLGRKPSAVAARAGVLGLVPHGECGVQALQRAWFGAAQ